jgi:hypothetical protein
LKEVVYIDVVDSALTFKTDIPINVAMHCSKIRSPARREIFIVNHLKTRRKNGNLFSGVRGNQDCQTEQQE